eukprot:COSAG01_NODE_952_length_12499_cov_84.157661_11_plen_133_part_00
MVGVGTTRYYVMDQYPQTLEQYIAGMPNRLSERQTLFILLQLAKAVAHPYAHGISHRDMKLSDICITGSGNVILCDFGCATEFINTSRDGNKANQPPEANAIPLGEPVNHRLFDVWALGCNAYELYRPTRSS